MRRTEFIPKLITCLQEGYSFKTFWKDLFAGLSVGVIAIPLSLAFAIGSGLPPEKGLFAAIIGGFFIAVFGGSRIQIAGPAGAFIALVYSIVERHGYEGLLVATFLAAFFLVIMGLLRFGSLLKFIPYPVMVGFSAGIGVLILSSQVKDFFGLAIERVPPGFLEKCQLFVQTAPTFTGAAIAISLFTLLLIVGFRRYLPKFPGALIAIIAATCLATALSLPLDTIGSKFGQLPRALSAPAFPHLSLDLVIRVLPDAFAVALLCAIESLLCAMLADSMIGGRHRPNCELIAQGIANLGSVFFGAMPVTGTIARTTANARLGGKTPIACAIHAGAVLLIMLLFAPLASKIPLAALAAVLVFVAWNMLEIPNFIEILRGQKGEALILLLTFFLTVFVSLTVAVQVGVVAAALIFLKQMTTRTTLEAHKHEETPKDTVIFSVKGPFFYSVTDRLDQTLDHLPNRPRVFLLEVSQMSHIDSTGLRAFKEFARKCKKQEIAFMIVGTSAQTDMLFKQAKVHTVIEPHHFFPTVQDALTHTRPAAYS
jgi:SulP family sulfate permease